MIIFLESNLGKISSSIQTRKTMFGRQAIIHSYFEALISHYKWRLFPETKEALGIHKGVGFHLLEWDGELHFLVFAPGANLGEQAQKNFEGFHHFSEMGLPTSWLKCRVEDDSSCVFSLDYEQLEATGKERLLLIPDLLAQDFQTFGAQEPLPCSECGFESATECSQFNNGLRLICFTCWRRMAKTVGEKKVIFSPVLWKLVSRHILGGMCCATLGWSGVLYLLTQGFFNITQSWFFFGLFLYGFGWTWWILQTQTGVTWLLRLAVICTALIPILLGNIWIFWIQVKKWGVDISWFETLSMYFQVQFQGEKTLDVSILLMVLIGTVLGFIFFYKPTWYRFR
jgi:hypothetical protein